MSSRSDAYAAVRKVLEALPSSHHGYWWSADDLARILSTGGVENVNEEIVSKAINHERRGTFRRDRTQDKRYFMLGEPIQKGWSVELKYQKERMGNAIWVHLLSLQTNFREAQCPQLGSVGKNATKSAAHKTDKVS